MDFAELDLATPRFTQKEAAEISGAGPYLLDNWVKLGHLRPDRTGGRRLFSTADLIRVDLMVLMQRTWRIQPEVSKHIADSSVAEYAQYFPSDLAEIFGGSSWEKLSGTAGDRMWGLVRDDDGTLRAAGPDDRPDGDMMVIVPTRLAGRRVLGRIQSWLATGIGSREQEAG